MLRLCIIFAVLQGITGYPEIGFIAKLNSGISRSSSGWERVDGWVTSVSSTNGLYSVGSLIENRKEVTITVSGVYFVAVSVAINNADTGAFRAAVVRNQALTEDGIGLRSEIKDQLGSSHCLDMNGFLNLRAGETIGIYAWSSADTAWEIRIQSTFSLHFMGILGANPGFMVNLRSDMSPTSGSFQTLKPWTSTTKSNHYGKSSGFSDDIGVLDAVCVGAYMLTANIIIEGPAGMYRLTSVVNDTLTTIASKVTHATGTFTLNLAQGLKLNTGANVKLQFHANVSGSKILSKSQWAMQFIGEVFQLNREFATFIREPVSGSGFFFNKVSELISNETIPGEFVVPSNLALVARTDFLLSEQAELYYVMANIHVTGEATNLQFMIAVSANGFLADGKEGPFSQVTKLPGETASVAFGGILYIQKDEYVSIFVKSVDGKPYTVSQTSYISMVKMRYTLSSFSARVSPRKAIQTTGWVELTQNWVTADNGLHLFTKDFASTTGRFTASFSGIYQLSANILFDGNAVDSAISLTAATDGVIRTTSGLYAVDSVPSVRTTLNIYGSIFLASGSYVSLFVSSSIDNQYFIDTQSSFSISLIGPSWAVPGFHAILSDSIPRTDTQNFEIAPWTNIGDGVSLFDNDENFNYTTGRYTAPETAIYIVSANIMIRNATHSVSGLIDIEGTIGGRNLFGIGLHDSKATHVLGKAGDFSLSFSGVVKMSKGNYISLFALPKNEDQYKIGKESMFSVVRWSGITSPPSYGFRAYSIADAIVQNKENQWQGIKDMRSDTLQIGNTQIEGGFQSGTGFAKQESSDIYTVQEPGIYFVSGSFLLGLANTALYEVSLQINKKETDYVLSAVEAQAKGEEYVLNFAGTLYLLTGQSLRIVAKTSASLYRIKAETSFSVIKLQLDEKNPGISVKRNYGSTNLATSQEITGYEVDPVPKLFVSNVGFNSPNGTYMTRASGIYLSSVSFVLGNASTAGTTTIGIVNSAQNKAVMSGGGSVGDQRTTLITRFLYLRDQMTFFAQLNATMPFYGSAIVSWSLYFMQIPQKATGMSGSLSVERQLLSSWTQISPWVSDEHSFPLNTTFSYSSFVAPKESIYHVTFTGEFQQMNNNVEVSHAVYINETKAFESRWSTARGSKISIPISASIKLRQGDIITFRAKSSDASARMTTSSTASVLDLTRVIQVQEGFFAYQPDLVTTGNTRIVPTILTNWVTSGRTGTFLAVKNSQTSNGTFVLVRAGFYQVSANLLIKNTGGTERVFFSYGIISKERETPENLYVKQVIKGNTIATLPISSIVRLERFMAVQIAIKAEDDLSFQILPDTTMSITLIDDSSIPKPCYENKLGVQNLEPEYKRIMTEKTFTYTCNVIGLFPVQYTWFKNNTVIPGETGKTLHFNYTRTSDSNSYKCRVRYQDQSATTNTGILSVYDPTPTIVPQRSYAISVQENRGALTNLEIFLVNAEKFAPGKAMVRAVIVEGDPRNEFVLGGQSTTSIAIGTTKSLDYEAQRHYVLKITAINADEAEARNTTILFNVTVIDVNDNPPKFNQTYIERNYPEDLPVGSPIVKVNATDIESGESGRIVYELHGNSSTDYFEINNETGLITLKAGLDREQRDRHVIIVTAKNMLFKAVAVVVVNITDVNDNRPIFRNSFYNLRLVENTPVSSSILQVFATDIDLAQNAEIRYRIVSYSPANNFTIDSNTGIITVASALDYETAKLYNLVIQAYDLGNPSLTSTTNVSAIINIIDHNDNAPQFQNSLYQRILPENSAVGSFVVRVVATDADGTIANSHLNYSIPSSPANEYFAIDGQGNITIRKGLDYERHPVFEFYVVAQDTGEVPFERITLVNITITDVNDNPPMFTPLNYYLNISEFTPVGTLVLKVEGNDTDSKILTRLSYAIESGNERGYFELSSNGELFVIKELDRETVDSVNLIVNLTDGQNSAVSPGRINITILDENDLRPTFTTNRYTATVSENVSIGHSILTVGATDGDLGMNKKITYSIYVAANHPSTSKFAINESTGVISVAQRLDYETQKSHVLYVIATDHGRVPLRRGVTVLINVTDVIDNTIAFEMAYYNASVPEDLLVNSFITRITAKDTLTGSSKNIRYSFIGSSNMNTFVINPDTGIVRLNRTLDYEQQRYYRYNVTAVNTLTPEVNLTSYIIINILEVNDNRPRFTQPYYNRTVMENITLGTSVIRVNATDNDLGPLNRALTYRIASNTSDFAMDNLTGVIRSTRNLDYHRQHTYSLIVIVSDRGDPYLTSSAIVDIFVTNINEMPIFTIDNYRVKVSEKALIGTSVLKVTATDNDPGSQGVLVYNIEDQLTNDETFYVSNNGDVFLNSTLDYETKTEYRFRVGVQDSGSPPLRGNSTALVIITVVDVNDNQPTFDINRYQRHIPEGTFSGAIITVRATDADDTSINNNTYYYIVPSVDAGNFTIGNRSGEIQSSVAFDRETVDKYVFQVEARDTGRNQLYGRAEIVIYITDINDNTPVPDKQTYTVNISETIFIGRQIVTIFATDRDLGENARITFQATGGDTDKFHVNGGNGQVTVLKKIYDSSKMFSLTVLVRDNGSPSRNVTVTINIHVSPHSTNFRFTKSQYTFKVTEGMVVSPLGTIEATDNNMNTTATYSIYNFGRMNVSELFIVDPNTGQVNMTRPLDYEVQSEYDFSVLAVSNRQRNAYSHVRILVLDVNERPFFIGTENDIYRTNVSEHVHVGSYIFSVTGMDNDTRFLNNAILSYNLTLPSSFSNQFSIDNSGRIMLLQPLDYEVKRNYTFQVGVRDHGNPPLYATATVIIDVTDYNDNAPTFITNTPMNVSIDENSPIGTFVGTIGATDMDSNENGRVIYSKILPAGILKPNSSTGQFFVDAQFDYEKIQSYHLIFVVEDNGTPVKLRSDRIINVHINNINDNRPIFATTYFEVTVIENAPIGTRVAAVIVSDEDYGVFGHIRRYVITNGNIGNTFSIDKLGHIILERSLNYKAITGYNLTIQAYDGGNPPLNASVPALISIKVREFGNSQPIFTLNTYEVTIPENEPSPTPIVNVSASSPDINTGPIAYSIINGNDSQFFTVNNITGQIHSTISFDYELRRRYSFSVLATDKTSQRTESTHVIVQVLDLNDNRPMFVTNKTTYNISDGASPGAVVYGFSATDADDRQNGQVVFSGGGGLGNASGTFAVNQDGTLFLEKTVDSRRRNIYTVIVTATDLGNPPLTSNLTVFVHVIDWFSLNLFQIRFLRPNYTAYVNEGIKFPNLINTTAIVTGEQAIARVGYLIEGASTETSPFTIDSSTGIISLITPLDYENKTEYNFIVTATTNKGSNAYTVITVFVLDVNDNGPQFAPSNYSATITEVTTLGAWVAQLTVKDDDTTSVNTPYTYRIVGGDPNGLFRIDNTGLIRLNQKVDTENPSHAQQLVLTVTVSEGNRNATATVYISVIDMNDVIPQTKRQMYHYEVIEGSPVGYEVGRIGAYDNDTSSPNNQYYFTLVNDRQEFKLETVGNEVKILVNGTLDYETHNFYELAIVVTDRGNPSLRSLTLVRVNVTDANDLEPVFNPTVYNNTITERTPLETVVIRVMATDQDSGAFGAVSYVMTDPLGTFAIDNDGNIRLKRPLDYEKIRFYTLSVMARDGENQPSTTNATVYINVREVNDNQPRFSLNYYYFIVNENASIGHYIGNVNATDMDYTGNQVSYNIVPSQISGMFTISPTTGEITLQGKLDYDNVTTRELSFSVMATDSGNFTLESRAVVIVRVTDYNDNDPVITPSSVVVNVSELAQVGSIVTPLDVTDIDSGRNKKISWSIFDNTNTFTVDNSGVVRLLSVLDYDVKNLYVFNVQVNDDGEPKRYANATVTVHVVKHNLERPIFLQKHYEVTLPESTPLGSRIVLLNYTRTFYGKGLPIEVKIKDTNRVPEMVAQNSTRDIILKNPGLNYERRKRYDFSVIISNSLGYSDVATVIVHVVNVNEHAPYFALPVYNITISELSFLGFTAIELVGLDNDTGSTGLTYSIVSGNHNHDFRMNKGRIIVNQTFQQAVYTFNVSVRDPGGLMGYTTVIINIKSENQPLFGNDTYIVYVYENVSISTSILQVTAGSLLRGITYVIEDTEALKTFSMDNRTGDIKTKVKLNYEERRQYIFPIMASVDTPVPLSDGAVIVVNVLDVNDIGAVFFRQVYVTTIAELHPVGSRVLSLNYTDGDINSGVQFTIMSGNDQGYFSINNRGDISLVKALTGERNSQYLRVRLNDGFLDAFANVTIHIIPRKRCRPEFERPLYVYHVMENTSLGYTLSPIVKLVNISTSETTFSLSNGNLEPTWFLNAKGILVLNQSLDYERETLYTSRVYGQNLGLSGHAAIVIHILDVNDEPPILTPQDYNVSISERTPVGSDVVTLNATDLDTKNLQYTLVSGNTNSTFTLGSDGTISLNRKLNFEGIRMYNLAVQVSDQRTVVNTTVTVYVLDVTETVVCHVNPGL